jgi:LAO/AO transport system ATPase
LKQFRRGDRRALARLLSLLAHGESITPILAGIGSAARPARVVAITGSAGVGKSTLVGKLIEQIRAAGLKVAVLACDPQSPLSGGALLGDRFRMPSRPEDDGVFIRSLATPGGHGAVAGHVEEMIRLLEAYGFDVILLETVGAGQGDTVVGSLADVVALLLQPETGDDLQWEKAGVLEVADVVAVHKADLPGAEKAEAQVRTALGLSGGREIPVLRVSSKTGAGLADLWQAIAAVPLRRRPASLEGNDLLRLAEEMLAARFARAWVEGRSDLQDLLRQWQQGRLPEAEAGARLLEWLATCNRPAP